MTPRSIIITNVLDTGSAFALLADDTTQNVFIPSKVANGRGIKAGDTVQATLVPNSTQPHKTPWLAVDLQVVSIDQRILAALADSDMTHEELADEVGLGVDEARQALDRLIKAGKLVRFEVFGLSE